MWTTHLLRQQCNRIRGMARLTSRQGRIRRSDPERYLDYVEAPALELKSSPVLSIVCMITASLRATATAARLKPILSRT